MFLSRRLRRSNRRRHPHVWRRSLLLIIGHSSLRSLAVDLFGLFVEWSALLDDCEACDLQCLAGLIACCNPRRLLATLAELLAQPCRSCSARGQTWPTQSWSC